MHPNATRSNHFNLIRLVAALMVIAAHSSELIDGNRKRELFTMVFGSMSLGELAVDAFFLLSGYLIMQSWSRQPRAWPFLQKRILRIYPGFLVATVVSALLVGPLGADQATYFADFDATAFLRSALLLQLPDIPPVFKGMHYPFVNGALWTISAEFSCYLSILILGMAGLLRVRYVWLALAAGTLCVFAWFKLHNNDPGNIRFAVFFLAGGCFYLYRDNIKLKGSLALIALTLLIVGLNSWRGAELTVATAGAYILFYLALKHSDFFGRFNKLPDISYGVYLYGWPVQMLIIWKMPTISPPVLFGVASLVAIVLGCFSWYMVEQPMLRLKARSASIAALPPTVSMS